ncbi:hypothetical protein BOW35_03130 [Solemya velum gill symbiont]|uniref:NapC/NirT family cytochrome c n=1 Tax=Solemya velum gill symbiont TaxID=2340 RepID=UPI00099843DB|nr:NapC/NirT family cytochrome c [Solemya velum gill symbiont]OOZ15830.1 hypothetical protein BOW27_02625 [Solemya velum gill symbiont]OOZ18368.1 hypothetical protein BOW28_02210 [Solemya velum gill symbiont]OOZ20806.1 hypothetical protein BOW29_00185 [Solemya velum gill symbiont]OOZ23647.1 hypothetical protein BOW30_01130 [Solemya velum gill symbiont]OOZ25189.1 hypothetical protein BOW31_02560 [Solemya velum gill symbiont]
MPETKNKSKLSRLIASIPLKIASVFFVIGILFWGALNTGMEWTNKMEFCISCHEMKDTVYQEYRETIHFKNAAGVQATCADCHVPKEWTYKVIRKIKAYKEIVHKVLGTIDTVDKFEEHRWTMANRVWDSMRATDSRECRNCHTFNTMDMSEQDRYARKRHERALERGQTCIDCHTGIAHKEPEEPKEITQVEKE